MAYLIPLARQCHNFEKIFIKPCMLKTASLVLGEANRKELTKISLSDSTLKTVIDEIEDVDLQVLKKIKNLAL